MTGLLRVALVSFYPVDPTRISGGIRAVAHLVAEGLRRRGDIDVHVIHCHSDIQQDHVVRAERLTAHYLALPAQRIVPNMISGMARIRECLAEIRPDVVNAHNPSYAVAALQAGYAPVWTVHGIPREEVRYNPGLFNRLAFALMGYYERQALARVQHITAISPYIRDRYTGRTRAQLHLIENPAPDDLFDLPRTPVPGRLLLPGSVIPRKDPITLVRALALARQTLPQLHLQIAGRTNETAYVAQVQAACREAGVADAVTLLGVQSQAEMRRHYAEAQLVTLSSREEVSPMSAIEALAAGIPVVTTRAGGAGYVVEDGCTGRVVEVGDAPGLARAIVELLSVPETYAITSARARSEAQRRFRLDRVVQRYVDVYKLAAS